SPDNQWKNLQYFLKAVVPEAEKAGVKLAMHPDDPQIEKIGGIARIMTTANAFQKMLDLYPSPANGITMCQANFSLMGEDIPTLAKRFNKNIHYVHFRNIHGGKYKFEETFHDEGQIDMYAALKAYYDIGFRGPMRPDHVPTMDGDTNERPGYSKLGALFAFGYIRGLLASIPQKA
ncbi:MAG: mannonate dehydratase, partial [Mucilaginibacter sp.]